MPKTIKGGYLAMQRKGHPIADKHGRVLMHWWVMYNHDPSFTVYAKKNRWTIHHKNGKRDDNARSNLEWRAPGQHARGLSFDDMIDALEAAGYTVTKQSSPPLIGVDENDGK